MAIGATKLGLPLLSPSSKSTPFTAFNRRSHRPTIRSVRLSVSASLVEEKGEECALLDFTEPETRLVEEVLGLQGRGRSASPTQLKEVERAVETLEELGGVPNPTSSELIEGRWQLIFTTRPGTASPIQRTFVGVDYFKVFQEIYLGKAESRVSNIVQFSERIGELKVEAEATIKDGKRILFRFDRAAFSFKFLPFKVPYPVPFRLLGDEAKGWLDTTYLSSTGNMRISRGNKGTTFVLQKKIDPRQRLLSIISVGQGVQEAIEEFVSLNQGVNQGLELVDGEWQLIWASQIEGENWSETVTYGYRGLQVIKKNNQLENVISFFPGFSVTARGKIAKSSGNNFDITMNDGSIGFGSLTFPSAVKGDFKMKLLYADNKIRITQNDKEVIFVHLFLGKQK